ncbi:MAG TPA: tellurite resistance/C4-dicarboxylate transporter family protein, partial [Caldilineaceae bacterium]|nr:tellurite resistance/C4-dicarboxylate transporter family protein [Caldilineaceae bacterium]
MKGQAFRQGVAGLFPGYFALVMATGIVSVASALLGMALIARLLLIVNLVAYVVLWALTLFRLLAFWPRVWADLTDHSRGPGFFTAVAGTCVLGSQLIVVGGAPQIARWLWLLGALLWLLIMYTFFAAVTVRAEKPPIERGLNGAWLLAIVATQSVAVLATLLALEQEAWRATLLFVGLC